MLRRPMGGSTAGVANRTRPFCPCKGCARCLCFSSAFLHRMECTSGDYSRADKNRPFGSDVDPFYADSSSECIFFGSIDGYPLVNNQLEVLKNQHFILTLHARITFRNNKNINIAWDLMNLSENYSVIKPPAT